MDTVFDHDTAVTRLLDAPPSGANGAAGAAVTQRFTATVASGWRAGRGPHGGYLAAMLLRAMVEAVEDPGRTPRSLTIHYTRAPEPGGIEIDVTVERAGRSLSTLSARMVQDGKTTALALAAFSVPWEAPGAHELPMPELAPADVERRSTPKLFKGAPEFTRHLVMQPRVGAVPFAGSGAPMRIGGWMGLPEQRPIDALSLTLFCDAWFPPSFIALDEPAISPTVDLTIHFRQPISDADIDPAALCLGVFETRLLHDGLFEEDGVVWAADGTVLAQSRQLGIIMPTDKQVLQPTPIKTGAAHE
ncbi:MAG TPA: thioesterase family protein [Solirubrobacteraceae bacterium]|jgi:acyl-CoA thioesterase|nr:thioesterase family protein [Solirubrobacteraceae bacterium]